MPIAIPDTGLFKKVKALMEELKKAPAGELKKAPAGESKKASALRAELDRTIRMLMWVCRRIDAYNDDAEQPFCPSQKTQCDVGADCRNCWLMAAMQEADRG